MDFDAYAHSAVDLVNAELTSMPDLRAFLLRECQWWSEVATEQDLAKMRRSQGRLRAVFDLGVAGHDAEAVATLNTLLSMHPMQPHISGHDSGDWHMHVTSRDASVSSEYITRSVWGLSVWLCRHGSSRFGVCADPRCNGVFLDTSSNCCRRYCSDRCATRAHVAAHRARKRAEVGAAAR